MGIEQYGGLAEGLSKGLMAGLQYKQNEQNNDLKNKIATLQQMRMNEELEIKKQQFQMQKEANTYNSTMKNASVFFDAVKKMKDPVSQNQYRNKLSDMPFYQKAPDDLKELLNVVNASDTISINDFVSATKDMQKALSDGDVNTAAQKLFEMEAIFGDSDNKGIQKVFDTATNLLGLKMNDSKGKTQSLSPIGKLISEKESLPPGSPYQDIYQKGIEKAVQEPKGQTININTMEKSTKGKLEQKAFDLGQQVENIKIIKDNLNPLLVEYGNLFNTLKTDFASKIGYRSTPQAKENLAKFTKLAQDIELTVADIRHTLVGSAITKTEMELLSRFLPKISTDMIGRFTESDSPISLETKINGLLNFTEKAYNRLQYALENGTVLYNDNGEVKSLEGPTGKKLSLNDPRFDPINKFASELAAEHPDWSDNQIAEEVKRRFGNGIQ